MRRFTNEWRYRTNLLIDPPEAYNSQSLPNGSPGYIKTIALARLGLPGEKWIALTWTNDRCLELSLLVRESAKRDAVDQPHADRDGRARVTS